MSVPKLVANSPEGQLQEVTDQFRDVQKAAETFERHQTKSIGLLHVALADLYAFGEGLVALPAEGGRSMAEAFVTANSLPWNKVTRGNPYNALAKLAFAKQSAASISQYAAVLRLASDRNIAIADFTSWLTEGDGIKGRYSEAVDHFGSTRRQLNSQARSSRIELATQTLLSRTHSMAVTLPMGVEAPEGFALVLARIDGANNAAIIDVVESKAAVIEPFLLRYETSKETVKSLLADKPLGQLYRAIDLVASITPDKIGSNDRNILLLNTHDRGRPICRVEAISKAYTYPWAGMVNDGHLNGLPVDKPLIMSAQDITHFHQSFADHDGWGFYAGADIELAAKGMTFPIGLTPIASEHGYRVGRSAMGPAKPIRVAQSEQVELKQFLDSRRADNDALNAKRKEKQPFTTTLTMRIEGGDLLVGLPKLLGLAASFGVTKPDRDLDQRALVTADIQRLLDTLIPYEVDIEGCFLDTDVEDAAICFDVPFDEDRLSITLPTMAGTAYSPCCEDLVV